MTLALPRPRALLDATVAGLIAGCLITACFVVMNVAVLHTPSFSLGAFFAFDASTLVGKVAYTSGAFVILGVVLHFLVSVAWAIGYAVLAGRQPQIVTRPIVSGAMFGLVVYFAMQLVLVAANVYTTPTPRGLGVALLAHLVFYGIPVALIIGRTRRPA